jgi:catechol 2,3-dioxygenase-like lactoylglutathione lyase family enzyme
MPVSEVHHVALSVRDLERSIAFYRDGLGFRKTLEMPVGGAAVEKALGLRPGTTGRSTYLQGPSKIGQLELIEWQGPPVPANPPKRPGDPGVFLLSFEVPAAEMDAVFARIKALGAPIHSEPIPAIVENYGEIRVFTTEDPDGVLIEICVLPNKEEIAACRAKTAAARAGTSAGMAR